MRIRAYIRLQDCTSNRTRAFVSRRQPAHGIAKGPIHYYAVEGRNWSQIRRTLKDSAVMGYSHCTPITVLGYAKDERIDGLPRLFQLKIADVPECAWWDNVKDREDWAPELTSFGPHAVEIQDGSPAA